MDWGIRVGEAKPEVISRQEGYICRGDGGGGPQEGGGFSKN